MLERGAEITVADPLVKSVSLKDIVYKSVPLTAEPVKSADVALLLTDHTAFDRKLIVENASLVVDTRNAFKGFEADHIFRV